MCNRTCHWKMQRNDTYKIANERYWLILIKVIEMTWISRMTPTFKWQFFIKLYKTKAPIKKDARLSIKPSTASGVMKGKWRLRKLQLWLLCRCSKWLKIWRKMPGCASIAMETKPIIRRCSDRHSYKTFLKKTLFNWPGWTLSCLKRGIPTM